MAHLLLARQEVKEDEDDNRKLCNQSHFAQFRIKTQAHSYFLHDEGDCDCNLIAMVKITKEV